MNLINLRGMPVDFNFLSQKVLQNMIGANNRTKNKVS